KAITIFVHGTGGNAASRTHFGAQEPDLSTNELRFVWEDSAHSESRLEAAKELAKVIKTFPGTEFSGHSHGGNVINQAFDLALLSKRKKVSEHEYTKRAKRLYSLAQSEQGLLKYSLAIVGAMGNELALSMLRDPNEYSVEDYIKKLEESVETLKLHDHHTNKSPKKHLVYLAATPTDEEVYPPCRDKDLAETILIYSKDDGIVSLLEFFGLYGRKYADNLATNISVHDIDHLPLTGHDYIPFYLPGYERSSALQNYLRAQPI
ncbi:hypothetical protein ACFLY6_03405, partial [Candidatus Dependentiae bacterium]